MMSLTLLAVVDVAAGPRATSCLNELLDATGFNDPGARLAGESCAEGDACDDDGWGGGGLLDEDEDDADELFNPNLDLHDFLITGAGGGTIGADSAVSVTLGVVSLPLSTLSESPASGLGTFTSNGLPDDAIISFICACV